jgi:hypothetical protein
MDEAPWNTCVSPCYKESATVECERTIHHLIALFCTVAGKPSSATRPVPDFCNEINNLERSLHEAYEKNRSR